ncbi:MAG: hypothetical protein PVG03_08055 [Desulfarculaceae bacterium]
MHQRNLFWIAVSFLALFMITAAPLAAFGDDCPCSQTDVGATAASNLPDLKRGIALAGASWAPPGQGSYAFGMVKTLGEDYAVTARFLHNTLTNAITDLGIELSDGAINCPDPRYIDMSLAQMPGSENLGVLNVAALCGGTIYGSQIIVDPANPEQPGSDWIKQEFDKAVGMNSMSASSVNVGGFLYQTVCGADGSGVYCWNLDLQPVQRRQFTAPMGQTFFTSRINHTHDSQGNIHMVGTDSNGRLGYAKFPAGSSEADASSIKWVGDASNNQSWDWTQVGVAPQGTVYISAFNTHEGDLYIFHKESGSVNHWFFNAIGSPDGEVGKYNSMAVDNTTGAAVIRYADSQGMPAGVLINPQGEMKWSGFPGWPFPAGESNINSTATAAQNGALRCFFASEGKLFEQSDCQLDCIAVVP